MSKTRRINRRWQNRPLVRERDAQRARWMWGLLALLIAALAPMGIYLFEQNKCLQLSYEMETIEKQRKTLAEAQRRLEVRYADVASMQRIERWATQQRLARPASEQIVVVPHDVQLRPPMMAAVPHELDATSPDASQRVD